MQSDGVEIIARETAYQGYFRIDRYKVRHRLFAGGISPEIRRDVFERGHAVAVILYDPDLDAVVLIEQFRIGAFTAGFPPWVTEIVAGIIDAGEQPDAVAQRETLEETGCEILDLIPVYRYLVTPGCSSESVSLFCARVDARKAGGIHGLKDEGEDIRVSVVPVAEALHELNSGRVNTSLGIIGLQWIALNRDMLRKRWSGERVPA
jgi:ADP-ribose pyrophosphatase